MKTYRPVILLILDGFGVSDEVRGNPVASAKKPTFDMLEKSYPWTLLQASSLVVGLPFGEPGNSEVGHLTIGAGRPIHHHLPKIIHSIRDGSFFQNPAFLKAVAHVRKNNSKLHLLGLASTGSVHSYIDHLFALLDFLRTAGFQKDVYLHILTDGKDSPPREGAGFIDELRGKLSVAYTFAAIASVIGRSFAMDRGGHWDKVKRAYDLLVSGAGAPFTDAVQHIKDSYKRGVTDEFIEPAYLSDAGGTAVGRIGNGDALIMYNFREDSEREMARAFAQSNFAGFSRTGLINFLLVTMTEYEEGFEALAAFPPMKIKWNLASLASSAGLKQLHIAEFEKYAHVTYFFNGGKEEAFPGEERILISSVGEAHFDERPEMNAAKISEAILSCFGNYDLVVANFANADMVGHTGNFEASQKAVEVLDAEIGKIMKKILESGGALLITADHGNVERKIDSVSGEKSTNHTVNPVPFFIIAKDFKLKEARTDSEIRLKRRRIGGALTDVAPTALELLGIEKQPEMIGKSLLNDLVEKIE